MGFTLLEIIIVVAIIAVLAVILLPRLARVRLPANDARRISDLRTIQGYLETYYLKNRKYPSPAAVNTPEAIGFGSSCAAATICGKLIADGVASAIPDDPISGRDYYYSSNSAVDPQTYVLRASMEGGAQPALDNDIDGTVAGMDCTENTADASNTNDFYCIQF